MINKISATDISNSTKTEDTDIHQEEQFCMHTMQVKLPSGKRIINKVSVKKLNPEA
jgi:hypothetical protein